MSSVRVPRSVFHVLTLVAALAAGARAQCLDWAEGFGVPGAYRVVWAATVFDDGLGAGPTLYVGGGFCSVGNTPAAGVARWNGSAFEPLGAGLDGRALCFAVHDDGTGPRLYVGGDFRTAGGQPAHGIARWDGVSWSPVGDGIDGTVHALEVFDDHLGGGPRLFAGGTAMAVGGYATWMLRSWDGTAWSEVGGGASGPGQGSVLALRVHDDGSGPALFVGGGFVQAGGQPAANIARWDGLSWSPLAAGTDSAVRTLCVVNEGGRRVLVAGGSFTQAGWSPAGRVAYWDGRAWHPLGTGVDHDVRALVVHDEGNGPALYAGGLYTPSGGATASGIARWDGTVWSPLRGGPGGVLALQSFDLVGTGTAQLLACGGDFGPHTVAAAGLAAWDGTAWSPLVSGHGVTGLVEAFEIFDDGSGPALYVGGGLAVAGAATAWPPGLVRWDGGGWSAVPPPAWTCKHPTALAVFDPGAGPGLFVGTDDCLAMWNGVAWDPSQLLWFHTQGTLPGVRALLVHDDGTGPALFIGGGMSFGVPPVEYLLRWDGAVCTGIGSLVGPVLALTSFDDGTGPALIAAGSTLWSGAGQVARWDGASWTFLGGTQPGSVEALAVFDAGAGPALFAGGSSGLLRWDGASWVPLGGPSIRALAVHDDGTGAGPGLYAAGDTVERWDGSNWSSLGAGVELVPPEWSATPWESAVRSLCSFDDGSGPRLWVGGEILSAGGRPSVGVARWGEPCGCTGATYCTAKTNSLGCVPSMGVSGITNLTATQPLMVFASQVLSNEPGLLFYGTGGAVSQPFAGGMLCARSPLKRTPPQSSGGNPPPSDCSGQLSMDFKSWALGGADPGLAAGVTVCAQYWYRDPTDPYGVGLTDAAVFTLCP